MSRYSINKSVTQAYEMTLESIPYTWTPGANQIVNLDFLSRAKQMRYPVIRSLKIRVQASDIDCGAGGGPMRELALMFSNIRVRDLNGFRFNVRGSSLRAINFAMDPTYSDTMSGANIAASATNQVREFFFRLRFDYPFRGRRPKDLGMPLAMLLDGGEISLTAAASSLLVATSLTVSAATYTIVAQVCDYGEPEIGPVLTWQDWQMSQPEYYYPINGYLLYAGAYVGEGNILAQTAWALQQITSKTFDYPALQDTILRDLYRERQVSTMRQQVAPLDTVTSFAAGAIEDPHLTGEIVPVFAPSFQQANIDLPLLENLHYRTSLGSITTNPIPTFIIGSFLPGREQAACERAIPGFSRLSLSQLSTVTSDGNNPPADKVVPKVQSLSALRVLPRKS